MERAKEIKEVIQIECKEDVPLCNEVESLLLNAEQPFEEVTLKVNVRQNRVRDTLSQSQKFQETFDDFLDKLSHLEERLDQEKPISAKLDTVKEQKREHAQVHNDVVQLEPVFAQVCNSAEEMREAAESPEEKEKVKEKIDDFKERYNKLKDRSTSRQKVLADEVNFTEKFSEDTKPFEKWLDQAESKLAEVEPLACEESALARQVKDVKEVLKEVEENKPKIQELQETCKAAVENAEVDQVYIEEDMKKDQTRYDDLAKGLEEKEKKLKELLDLTQEYKKHLKPVDEVLDRVEKALADSQTPYGVDEDKIQKQREKLSELAKELESTRPNLNEFNTTADKLVEKADPKAKELPALQKEVESVNERFRRLNEPLLEECKKLDDYADKAKKFNNANKDFEDWLTNATKTPGMVEPIGSEPEVLKRQIKEVEVCILWFWQFFISITVTLGKKMYSFQGQHFMFMYLEVNVLCSYLCLVLSAQSAKYKNKKFLMVHVHNTYKKQ